MGCGASNAVGPQTQRNNNVVVLMELLEAYAHKLFLLSATWTQRRIPTQYLDFEFDWRKVKIVSLPIHYENSGPVYPGGGENGKYPPLTQLEYQNKLEEPAQHKFEASCPRKCIGTVRITQGVDLPQGVVVPLPVYDNNPAASKFPDTVRVGGTHQISHTVEEPVTWIMKTTITIPPHKAVLARLSIVEEEHTQKFTMRTRMSGLLRIVVKNNVSGLHVKSMEAKLHEVLRNEPAAAGTGGSIQCKKNHVDFVTTGSTYFRFGIKTIEESQEITPQPQQQQHQLQQQQHQQQQQQQQQQQPQQYQQQQHPQLPQQYQQQQQPQQQYAQPYQMHPQRQHQHPPHPYPQQQQHQYPPHQQSAAAGDLELL